MTERFEIVEMEKAGGQWRIRFGRVPNDASFGSPCVFVDAEEFRGPKVGMHQLEPHEVIDKAHRAVANSLFFLFKASVMSIPNVDWESVKQLSVSEILSELGLDDGA